MTEENTTQNMPFDLYKSETLERFQDNLVECATYNMTQESHQMSLIIRGLLEQSPNLQTDQPELYQKYWELYWQFCWIALNYFSDERVIAMFQKHYLVSADIPFIDIWDKVKFISLNHILIEDRNRFKESIIKALRKNQEVLTKETVTKDGKENPGTVGHWIMDSTIELGLKSVEAVKLAEYLVNSTNTKSLSKESRDRIRKLIDLIEHLKIPSDTLEGYEPIIAIDDDRSVGAIRAGVWEQYDDSLKKIRQSIADTMDSLNLGPASGSVTPAKAKEPIQRRTATQTLKKEPAVLPDITLKEVKHLQTKDLINIYTQNKEEQTAIYEEE
ncbi:hypothetical protein KKG41_00930, partial [Patescibacteria group bacterium]|nr:hypothetical protein [Patescibacteria group bacterium]MBU1890090.1 hypothetical protein [Patescibacteria group bacterium]